MNLEAAVATLRESEADLRARGVLRAGLFGSVARGDQTPGSDVDVLIEIDPAAGLTVFDYVGLKGFISDLFPTPVDVVDRDALKPHLVQPVTRELVYAF